MPSSQFACDPAAVRWPAHSTRATPHQDRQAQGQDARAVVAVDQVAGRQGQQQGRRKLQQAHQAQVPGRAVSSYICQPTATISIWLAATPARRATTAA
jgi:hypothetical protein